MNPGTMLAEIVESGPNFIPLGTIGRSTLKATVSATLRRNFMNTLLVAFQIVVSTKMLLAV